jgi:hypothetical protein
MQNKSRHTAAKSKSQKKPPLSTQKNDNQKGNHNMALTLKILEYLINRMCLREENSNHNDIFCRSVIYWID